MSAYKFFSSEFFNFEFLRVLGTAPFEGAEIGECLEAAKEIKSNDPESWHRPWSNQAVKAEALGDEAFLAGDKEAARWAFIRASNYYPSSEFMLHHLRGDKRLLPTIEKATASFKKGIALLDSPVHVLSIPFQHGVSLPAYLYMPSPGSRQGNTDPIPIIINNGGLDSIQEELYYYVAAGARTRGYAVLTFDGPGQGLVLRKENIPLRPDWEVVTNSAIDFIMSHAAKNPSLNLDITRISAIGASLGGFFSLRGAAGDPRVKAIISVDGFFDLGAAVQARIPPWFLSLIENGWITDGIFNNLFALSSALNFQTRWEFGHSMWAFGGPSPAKVLREFAKYTLAPEGKDFLANVRCPVMVTGARETLYDPPEVGPMRMYNALPQLKESEKKIWIGTTVSDGGLQAKVAALAVSHFRIFSWLDDQMGIVRK
ncbi:hypothetical protein V500_02440 [Pseudogymnoascus sp. VKM F-4518 (FW-2643)]|nr:hypothetical protein V500_02440 [Pseudogymnoascus sp. VKM F-4518 (FW-2643)]